MIFACDQLNFEENGSLTIWLHGIKNDANRDGFQFNIPACTESIIDPVSSLRHYIQTTDSIRPTDTRPVFISLKRPYKAVTSGTIAKDLEKAISLAGLEKSGYTAKNFRPTGATTAIRAGCNPDNVRTIGRWKCRETFEQHYVYPEVGTSFTDSILQNI